MSYPGYLDSPVRSFSRMANSRSFVVRDSQQLPLSAEKKVDDKKVDVKRHILVVIIPVIFSIIILVSSIYLIKEDKDDLHRTDIDSATRVLKRVFKNLDQDPITDIIQKSDPSTCPIGYNQINIGEWQGVQRGCLCGNGKVKEWHECFTDTECVFVKNQSPQAISKWFNYQYCAKRSSQWKRKAQCSITETKCASDLCVENPSNCPNNIVTCQDSTPTQIAAAIATNLQSTTTGNFQVLGNKLCQTRFTGTGDFNLISNLRPIVDFELSTANGVICLDNHFASRQDLSTYPLSRQKNVGCNKFGQIQSPQNVKRLVTPMNAAIRVQQLQQDNQYQNIINDIPQWNTYVSNNYYVYLNIVERFEVNQAAGCRDFDKHIFETSGNWSAQSRDVVYVLAWIMASLSILVLVLAVVFLLSVASDRIATEERTKLKLAKVYTYTSFLLAIFSIIVALWFFFFINWHMASITTQLSKFYADNCIVEPAGINMAIGEITLYETQTTIIMRPHMWLILISTIVYILAWIFIWRTWKKRAQQQ